MANKLMLTLIVNHEPHLVSIPSAHHEFTVVADALRTLISEAKICIEQRSISLELRNIKTRELIDSSVIA